MPDQKGKVTLQRIADLVGCSRPVVSKVLNGAAGSMGVSEELRRRIEQAGRELDYQGNYHASGLRTGRSGIVGLLHGADYLWRTDFARPLMDGVDVGVRKGGHDLMVVGPGREETELPRAIRYIKQGKLDALVVPSFLYGVGRESESIEGLPVVTAVALEHRRPAHVDVDLRPGTRELMQHLANLGHERILWFGRERALDLRHVLARECAQEAGLRMEAAWAPEVTDEALLADMPYLMEHYTKAFAGWLRENDPTPAVLATDEKAAFGVCRALLRAGLRVPHDVSVAGYDDIRASLCDPPLTVVSQSLTRVGETAARLALKLADAPERAADILQQSVTVPSRLVVRRSTGPAPG